MIPKLAILPLLFTACLTAQVPQRKGVAFGSFSSLHYIAEGAGDVVGMELLVIPNMTSAYVVFQCAEGVPSEPALVPAKVIGPKIEFTVKQRGGMCNGEYRGDANSRGMLLKGSSAKHPEFLLRKRSYWAQ
jgi:hypothetical protein